MRTRVLAAVGLLLGTGVVVAGPIATAATAPGTTQLVSVRDDGSTAPGADDYSDSTAVAISQDGAYVGFATTEALDPADTDPATRDVYVRDLRAPGHTVLISQGVPPPPSSLLSLEIRLGPVAGRGDSGAPSLSATGRFVAFETTADNLPDGDTDTAGDVVVCDRDPDGDGVFDERAPDGTTAYRYVLVGRRYDASYREWTNDSPSVSADGMTLVWKQHDRRTTGIVAARLSLQDGVLTAPAESEYVELAAAEQDQATEVAESAPRVSADGRQVVFTVRLCGPSCVLSFGPRPLLSLAGAQYGWPTVVEVEDLTNRRTVRVGPGTGDAVDPVISGDGRVVAYQALPGTDSVPAVHAVDRDPDGDGVLGPDGGEPVRDTVASRDNAGRPGYAAEPALSADGRYLTYATADADMHNGVTPPSSATSEGPPAEIVARDLVVDAQRDQAHLPPLPGELVSVGLGGSCAPVSCGANGVSSGAVVSGDGRVVAFGSRATDLVDRPQACCRDRVFARTFRPFPAAAPADFGLVPLGSSLTRTITLRHNGFSPLHITGVTVSGADFAVFPAQTCVDATLYETGGCLVSVRFTPSALGSRSAVLRIDALGAAPALVPVTGTGGGTASGFTATPNPLVFNDIKPALTATAPQAVTITNGGPVPWNVTAVRVHGGPHLTPGDFRITGNTCSTLLPGRSCAVSVVATGHGAGRARAVLSIEDTSAGSPHLVGLAVTTTVPAVQVSPAALPSGRVAFVTGQGFPVDHEVTVNRADATPVTVRTSATGTFAVPLVIFDHAVVGSGPVTVTSAGTTLRAQAPLLIVLGTFQPPGFSGRR